MSFIKVGNRQMIQLKQHLNQIFTNLMESNNNISLSRLIKLTKNGKTLGYKLHFFLTGPVLDHDAANCILAHVLRDQIQSPQFIRTCPPYKITKALIPN